MSQNFKFAQLQDYSLAGAGAVIGDTTITLKSMTDIDGNALSMSGTFGSKGFGTLAPGNGTLEEQISFTGLTNNSNGTVTLTGVKSVSFTYPYTETSGLAKTHAGSTPFVISNTSGFYDQFVAKDDDGTVSQVITFSASPVVPDPVGSTDAANKEWVLSVVNGGSVSTNALIENGTAGETLSAGQVVYLKEADGRWWKADASTASTVNNVQLGIAQGAGTAGNTITGGVLRRGIDSHQSGGVAGSIGYIRNSGGLVSTSAGTIQRAVGNYLSVSTFDFDPAYYYVPTADQKGAMGTITVPPSASNKFLTQNELGINAPLTIPLGESFTGATTPQPAVIINDLFQSQFDGMNYCGMLAIDQAQKLATAITPRSNVTIGTIYAVLAKVGNPSDNIQITIQSDSAGSPSGSTITNGTSNPIAGSSLSSSTATYSAFTFSTPFSLTAGTKYWVVFERTSTTSSTNYYLVGGKSNANNTNDYASFTSKYYTSSWQTSTYNYLQYFEMLPSSGSGSLSLWQSQANATNPYMRNCMGICTTTGSAGANGSLYQSGPISGFSGLIPQVDYYVSTTKGLLVSTSGGQFVGTATSATQLYIPSSAKIGSSISYGGQTGFGVNLTGNCIFKMPYNGTFVSSGGNSANYTITVADDSAISVNTTVYTIIGTAATKLVTPIQVRKGQFVQPSTSSNETAIFIPQF